MNFVQWLYTTIQDSFLLILFKIIKLEHSIVFYLFQLWSKINKPFSSAYAAILDRAGTILSVSVQYRYRYQPIRIDTAIMLYLYIWWWQLQKTTTIPDRNYSFHTWFSYNLTKYLSILSLILIMLNFKCCGKIDSCVLKLVFVGFTV